MTFLAEKMRMRLKVMLGVVSQFNFKCHRVRLRFIGTHFDHNGYIIRFFIIIIFSISPYGAMEKFWTIRTGRGSRISFS